MEMNEMDKRVLEEWLSQISLEHSDSKKTRDACIFQIERLFHQLSGFTFLSSMFF